VVHLTSRIEREWIIVASPIYVPVTLYSLISLHTFSPEFQPQNMGHNTVTTIRDPPNSPILRAVINDGDINILNHKTLSDLNDLLDSIKDDPDLKVLIFSSSNPDFFIAHLSLMPNAGIFLTILKSLSLMDENFILSPVLEGALSVSRKILKRQFYISLVAFIVQQPT
jgi:hypothetical protein